MSISLIAIIVQTLGILTPILFLLRQMKQIRVQMYYSNVMSLEKELNDKTKDVWGIPDDNKLDFDGKIITLDLEKLSYMVRFLDNYGATRTQRMRWKRPKEYSSNSLVYKMFENERYRDYWKCIVKKRFYAKGKFVTAIDRTIGTIEEHIGRRS